MGLMKKTTEAISHSLGLDGNINADVVCIAERVLEAHKINEPQRKAMETADIAKLMRELRVEIADEQEKLWEDGKLTKRECCVCHKTVGYKEGNGGVTHTYCQKHYDEAMIALGQVS